MCCVFRAKRVKESIPFDRQTCLCRSSAFPAFKGRSNDSTNARLGFLSRTRDSIINYSDERMRPRVKGSFLNARCGLTDSPPCPPTAPPTPCLPAADIPDAGAPPSSTSGSPYVHVRIRARPDFTTIERYSWFSFLLILFFFYWTKVASYERVYAFPDICRHVNRERTCWPWKFFNILRDGVSISNVPISSIR